MDAPDQPQIYLISPPAFDLSLFPDQLAQVLDGTEIACVRLQMASQDEEDVARAADTLRELCHARDVAFVITDHVQMVQRLGLDGVHLSDAARSVRATRKELGPDAIVGAFCGTSRHDGMAAGEAGADYVSFGPLQASVLGDGSMAEADLFQWWSEVFELPVVAEGGVSEDRAASLSSCTDFFAIGDEIWRTADPLATLIALRAEMT